MAFLSLIPRSPWSVTHLVGMVSFLVGYLIGAIEGLPKRPWHQFALVLAGLGCLLWVGIVVIDTVRVARNGDPELVRVAADLAGRAEAVRAVAGTGCPDLPAMRDMDRAVERTRKRLADLGADPDHRNPHGSSSARRDAETIAGITDCEARDRVLRTYDDRLRATDDVLRELSWSRQSRLSRDLRRWLRD
jgi:hypothetical protein